MGPSGDYAVERSRISLPDFVSIIENSLRGRRKIRTKGKGRVTEEEEEEQIKNGGETGSKKKGGENASLASSGMLAGFCGVSTPPPWLIHVKLPV